jgi:hypothetical protein
VADQELEELAHLVTRALLEGADPGEVARRLAVGDPDRAARLEQGLRQVADRVAALREYLSGPDRSVRPVRPHPVAEDYPGLAALRRDRELRDSRPAGEVAWPVERPPWQSGLAVEVPYPVAGPGAGPQCPVVARPAVVRERRVRELPDLAVYRDLGPGP